MEKANSSKCWYLHINLHEVICQQAYVQLGCERLFCSLRLLYAKSHHLQTHDECHDPNNSKWVRVGGDDL